MALRLLFLLLLHSTFAFAQNSVPPTLKEVEIEDDYWEAELTPLTNMTDILNYIHHDPFKANFIHAVPAGYPLLKEIDINSFYGARLHPVHGVFKFHRGIDLKGATGEVAIATGDGIVLETGEKVDLGKYIKIKHKYGFESIYGHLSVIKVKKGDKIVKSQVIGKVGATGTVTGPHLHYTLKKNEQYIDPFDFLFMEFEKESY